MIQAWNKFRIIRMIWLIIRQSALNGPVREHAEETGGFLFGSMKRNKIFQTYRADRQIYRDDRTHTGSAEVSSRHWSWISRRGASQQKKSAFSEKSENAGSDLSG